MSMNESRHVVPHSDSQAFAKLLVTMVAVLSLASLARAQEGEFPLRLEVTQRRFLVGEPVRVCVVLVNRGRKNLQFWRMSTVIQTMLYSIRSGDSGSFERYSVGIATDPNAPLDLAPGSTYKAWELIHFNSETGGLAFPAPGRYTIRGEYFGLFGEEYFGSFSGKPRPAPSDVAIEITAPETRDQAGAVLFSQRGIAGPLGLSVDAGVKEQLWNLASRTRPPWTWFAPPSIFGLYSRFFLAWDTVRHATKPNDYAAAIRLMSEADKPGFQLRPEVLLYLAQWSKEIAGASAAAPYLERLRREFPESCAAFQAETLIMNTR
jgi:hypothetical protein